MVGEVHLVVQSQAQAEGLNERKKSNEINKETTGHILNFCIFAHDLEDLI
jgi:hypothetical protein